MAGRISPPELWTAEKIIELIQAGNLPPWAKPWSMAPEHAPHNLMNPKIPSRGLNYGLLSMAGDMYGSPFFETFNQVTKMGCKVTKGEHSWPVFFFTTVKRTDDDGEEKKSFVCKGYKVFNVKQTNIPAEKIPVVTTEPETFAHTPIETCERIVEGYVGGPEVVHQGQRAAYRASEDRIFLPERNRFHIAEEYYCARFHEMGHSTGHSSRLNREAVQSVKFGDHQYSGEELVAEFCAAMLCGKAGIAMTTIENSAAYIEGWGKRLKPEMLVLGSREARKAFELIVGEAVAKDKEEEAA